MQQLMSQWKEVISLEYMQLTPPQMEAHLSQRPRGQVSAGPSLVGPVSEPNAWAPLLGALKGAPKSGVGCGGTESR